MEVAVLRELPRRVCERGPGGHPADPTHTELPGEQVRAEERERIGEEEERVVGDESSVRAALGEQRDGRVPDEGIRECERVVEGPERVGLPEIQGRLEKCVADPGDLPRLQERIPEVLPDVAAEMEDERPAHDDREGDAPDRGENRLPRGQLARHDDSCVGLAMRRRSCRAARAPRATAPKSVVGTYHAACTRIVNASACSWSTSRSPSEATPSHS